MSVWGNHYLAIKGLLLYLSMVNSVASIIIAY
jgi:hypothetical protein